jgi:hypothetical protein
LACQSCFREAASGMQLICPNNREMKAFNDDCLIYYSNESLLFVPIWANRFTYIVDSNFVTDMVSINATRWILMPRLAAQAVVSKLLLANESEQSTRIRMAYLVVLVHWSSNCNKLLLRWAKAQWRAGIRIGIERLLKGNESSCYLGGDSDRYTKKEMNLHVIFDETGGGWPLLVIYIKKGKLYNGL